MLGLRIVLAARWMGVEVRMRWGSKVVRELTREVAGVVPRVRSGQRRSGRLVQRGSVCRLWVLLVLEGRAPRGVSAGRWCICKGRIHHRHRPAVILRVVLAEAAEVWIDWALAGQLLVAAEEEERKASTLGVEEAAELGDLMKAAVEEVLGVLIQAQAALEPGLRVVGARVRMVSVTRVVV